MYNNQNIFAKIIRKEIPSTKVYEDEKVLAFHDISKSAPIHVLVVPKGEYTDYIDFTAKASAEEIANFFKKVSEIAKSLEADKQGFRIVSNCGSNAGQSVMHFHVHILSGKKMGHSL